MVVTEFTRPLHRSMLIGVMLLTSLFHLSTLFGGGGEGYGLKKGSSYMHVIVWKTWFEISAGCEENKDQDGPSVPTHFVNDCSYMSMQCCI